MSLKALRFEKKQNIVPVAFTLEPRHTTRKTQQSVGPEDGFEDGFEDGCGYRQAARAESTFTCFGTRIHSNTGWLDREPYELQAAGRERCAEIVRQGTICRLGIGGRQDRVDKANWYCRVGQGGAAG